MAGTITDIDPACGDGVRWILRKGLTPSVAAKLDNINADWTQVANGQSAPITTTNVVVSVGTAIYLVIDPIDTYNCDSTVIDLNIAKFSNPIYYFPILQVTQ